jgi:hypothetical protein
LVENTKTASSFFDNHFMSQFPYDEFSKQIAEVSLELAGVAEPAKTIPGETREIDFYFLPSFSPAAQAVRRDLGLLGSLANQPSTFEFFTTR